LKVEDIKHSIELSGAEAWAIVTGVPSFPLCASEDEPFIVTAEGVKVCIATIREGSAALLALACAHASHGAHPKVAGVMGELREQVKAAGLDKWIRFQDSSICPVCGGAEWLPPDSEQARGLVVMAHSFGIFRGIKIPKAAEGLTDIDQLSMIRELFAGITLPRETAREAQGASASLFPLGGGRGVGFSAQQKGQGEEHDGRDSADD